MYESTHSLSISPSKVFRRCLSLSNPGIIIHFQFCRSRRSLSLHLSGNLVANTRTRVHPRLVHLFYRGVSVLGLHAPSITAQVNYLK